MVNPMLLCKMQCIFQKSRGPATVDLKCGAQPPSWSVSQGSWDLGLRFGLGKSGAGRPGLGPTALDSDAGITLIGARFYNLCQHIRNIPLVNHSFLLRTLQWYCVYWN